MNGHTLCDRLLIRTQHSMRVDDRLGLIRGAGGKHELRDRLRRDGCKCTRDSGGVRRGSAQRFETQATDKFVTQMALGVFTNIRPKPSATIGWRRGR